MGSLCAIFVLLRIRMSVKNKKKRMVVFSSVFFYETLLGKREKNI
jgi:hypothetical protein